MKIVKYIFLIAFMSIGIIACKSDSKDTPSNSKNGSHLDEKTTTNRLDESLKKKMDKSVVSKMMFTEEASSFISYLISVDLIDQLSIEDGPFTVLIPSNEAFNALTEDQLNTFHNYREKENLKSVLNSHIINGNMDSASLVQEIKKNKGKLSLTTLSGAVLTFSKNDSDIIVSDANGTKARIGKSDIKGSNGIVHLLDAVLNMN